MNEIPQISNAEWEVMRIIWDKAPIKSADIVKALEEKDWSTKTIQTLVRRLLDKGVITNISNGKVYMYDVLIPETEYIQKETDGFLKRVYSGSIHHLMLNFVKNNNLSNNEVEELITILKNKKD